jgi:hypothetical protein
VLKVPLVSMLVPVSLLQLILLLLELVELELLGFFFYIRIP